MRFWPALAVAAAALPTQAQNPPPICRAPVGVHTIASLSTLPAPVRNTLLKQTPDIVDATQPFDATDVVMNGAHFNRFAFAWKTPDRFVIVTEHGGIAYYNPIYVVPSAVLEPPVAHLPVATGQPRNVCSVAQSALNSALPPKR